MDNKITLHEDNEKNNQLKEYILISHLSEESTKYYMKIDKAEYANLLFLTGRFIPATIVSKGYKSKNKVIETRSIKPDLNLEDLIKTILLLNEKEYKIYIDSNIFNDLCKGIETYERENAIGDKTGIVSVNFRSSKAMDAVIALDDISFLNRNK